MQESLEKSLIRLNTDYIDLYYLHSPSMETLENNPEIIDLMTSFIKSGKIRSIGISIRSPEDGLTIIEKYKEVTCIQTNFNMMDIRAHDSGLFKKASENSVGIVGRTPLCFGFLTGDYDDKTEFRKGDHRLTWKKEQIKSWVNGYKSFRDSIELSDNMTDAQFAIGFCLSFPEVTSVIPGMLTPEHVVENAKGHIFPHFSPAMLDKIFKMHEEIDFFVR